MQRLVASRAMSRAAEVGDDVDRIDTMDEKFIASFAQRSCMHSTTPSSSPHTSRATVPLLKRGRTQDICGHDIVQSGTSKCIKILLVRYRTAASTLPRLSTAARRVYWRAS